ncbi:hypothetical protein BDN70DRAFT_872537 [Pholiota conissans]|uniref:C2H2-type domain-containing protein n=1 Tax=Pholiota conissans TaxID=109636 RepID=A0A9P6CYW2_9AGAR|nr:hypothetical protein BDN70DRAFT_872537 [Pholiota conissans]
MDDGFFTVPTILGKRKAIERNDILILRLAANLPGTQYEFSEQHAPTNKRTPIIINGALVEDTKKRYCCTYDGCGKAYTKPSRLEEHERSHTGQRPFVCETCGNSYLREAHLHAHSRCHLPESSRPFECDRESCGKRFWTSQHLTTHIMWHDGAKPYTCSEGQCRQSFSKHHLLRGHICKEHAPAGTKPYRCEYEGCTKSFDTNQHLRTHQKTHDSKRYTCVQASCIESTKDSPPYFPTWSALQTHIRTTHPPTCPHPSCDKRTFANQGNLRAHLKLHECHQADAKIDLHSDAGNESDLPDAKKRRGGEHGRDWKCENGDCEKDFKSKKALNTHIKVTHLGKRDFVCDYEGCLHSFGYKHLLQRHQAKTHQSIPSTPIRHEDDTSDNDVDNHEAVFDIDMITGNTYAKQAEARVSSANALRCPFPFLYDLVSGTNHLHAMGSSVAPCDYVFTRGYDARRHLKASHGVVVAKDAMDKWVGLKKKEC